MKTRFAGVCQAMALILLICSLSAFGSATDQARFVVIPPKPAIPGTQNFPASDATLQTWNGSFTYNNQQYNYVMVGQDPSTGQGTVVTAYLIPVKFVMSNGDTYDPLGGGATGPLARTLTSPIFDGSTNYTQGGVNVGTTQYVDAFQRANFWSVVQNHPNYHVLLGGTSSHVTVLPELTLNVPAADGHTGTAFGHTVGEVDLNWYDVQVSNYMAQNPTITPAKNPIFIAANMYWTSGGCCVGGYHSANGAQSYNNFTYLTYTGVFSQDVSALSHEISEWMDDPLTPHENFTPCGILEVGDPLEGGSSGHPYGTWAYPLHGFTYHLQDEVFLRYFGGPADTSVNSWWTFQNYPYTTICQQGS
jgi:hypothetical protein